MSYIFENLLLDELRKLIKSCPVGEEVELNKRWRAAKKYDRIFLTELNCFGDPVRWDEIVPGRKR